MSAVRRRREEGCCQAFTKQGSSYAFRGEDFPALMAHWKAGSAFFDGFDFHGDPQSIKLGDVVAVRLDTPKGIAAARAEGHADAAEDKAEEFLP